MSALRTISLTKMSLSPSTTQSIPPMDSTNSPIHGTFTRVAGASCQAHGPPAMSFMPALRAASTCGRVSIRLKFTSFSGSFFMTPPNVEEGGFSPK